MGYFLDFCTIKVPNQVIIIPQVPQKHKTPQNRYIKNIGIKLEYRFHKPISPSTRESLNIANPVQIPKFVSKNLVQVVATLVADTVIY